MPLRDRVLALVVLGVLGSGVAVALVHGGPGPSAPSASAAPAGGVDVPAAPPVADVAAPRNVVPVRAVGVPAKPLAVVRRPAKARAVVKPKAGGAVKVAAKVPAKATAAKPKAHPRSAPRPKAPAETPVHRGQRVLASLHYDWQRLGYRIVFLPERKGYLGFTDGGTKTVTIWIRKRETDVVLAHTIAHELGHALDFSRGNDAKHSAYLSLRGMSPLSDWYGCNGCTDYRTPAGDWAEVFAYWLAGPGDYRSQMGPPPDRVHMAAIAQLFKL